MGTLSRNQISYFNIDSLKAPMKRLMPVFVFLGAGQRFELLNSFRMTLESLKIKASFLSIDKDEGCLPPIADLSEIFYAPLFETKDFDQWLLHFLQSNRIDFVIPCMDSAIRSLAHFNLEDFDISFFPKGVSHLLTDKFFVRERLLELGLPTPTFSGSTPKVIVKKRFGFGSRFMKVLDSDDPELLTLLGNDQFIVQDFIQGGETSIDVYVDRAQGFHMIARDRIKVVEGEVMITSTRPLKTTEKAVCELFLSGLELAGPINIQLIGDQNHMIDVNPRFGGGATASLKAGWSADLWLIREYLLGQEVPETKEYRSITVTRSRRDHVR